MKPQPEKFIVLLCGVLIVGFISVTVRNPISQTEYILLGILLMQLLKILRDTLIDS